MQRICAVLPQVSAYPYTRPSQCLYCGGGILHKHGEVSKRIKDIYAPDVAVTRYLCVDCKRAFAHRPQGVDRSGCNVRLRALTWALGLSRGSVGCALTALGSPASRMSDWRAAQEAGRATARRWKSRLRMPFDELHEDGGKRLIDV